MMGWNRELFYSFSNVPPIHFPIFCRTFQHNIWLQYVHILMCLLLKVCLSTLTFHFKSWWFYIKKFFFICLREEDVECSLLFMHFQHQRREKKKTENENEKFFKLFASLHIAFPLNPHFERANFSTFFNICLYTFV